MFSDTSAPVKPPGESDDSYDECEPDSSGSGAFLPSDATTARRYRPKSDGQPRPSSHSRRHYSKRLTHRQHSMGAERPPGPDSPTQSPMSSPKPPPRLRRRQQSAGNIGLYVEESQEISVGISGEFFYITPLLFSYKQPIYKQRGLNINYFKQMSPQRLFYSLQLA